MIDDILNLDNELTPKDFKIKFDTQIDHSKLFSPRSQKKQKIDKIKKYINKQKDMQIENLQKKEFDSLMEQSQKESSP